MAWNEPGGSGGKDPWGNRNNEQGPPDLDEIIRKLQKKFSGMFGGKGGGDKQGSAGNGSLLAGIGFIVVIIVVIWGLSGFYIIEPAERGVILRFGRYVETVGSGPNWHVPYPIESVEKVNVDQVRNATHKAEMLTKDENLITIALAVQYKVKNAKDYLYNVRDPDYTLKEASESALREVAGSKRLDDILSESGGREILVNETEKEIQNLMDLYNTGITVLKVNLESAQPPQDVQAAFEDAIKAREDEDRYKKQAEAYERDIIPKAEGDAERLGQEAEAYKQQTIEQARGETSRFLQTLDEYRKAPEVTRKRLYLETMEGIMSKNSKIVVDVDKGSNMLYLPLDQIMRKKSEGTTPTPAAQGAATGTTDRSDKISTDIDDAARQRTRTREQR